MATPGRTSMWSTILNRGVRSSSDRRKRCHFRDIEATAQRVERISSNLFGSEVDFDACEVTEKGIFPRQILSERDIGRYLEETDSSISQAAYHSQLFYFYQSHSWGRLIASEDCFLKVLSYFDVFPDFVDIITGFGSKDGPIDEVYGCYKFSTFTEQPQISSSSTDGDSFLSECCYLLKYVDLHHRSTEQDRPWSIRQMGVYQKFDFKTNRSIDMLLQPSSRVTETLAEMLGPSNPEKIMREEFCLDWTRLHLVCLGTIRNHWRDYINSLDTKVIAMAGKLRFSKVDDKGIAHRNHQQTAAFSNLQDLEEINDELLRLKHVLDLNIKTLQTMTSHTEHLQAQAKSHPDIAIGDIGILQMAISSIILEFEFHMKAVNAVYERSARVLSTLGAAIAIQDSHTIKTLALIRNEGNAVTEKLTWETIRETRTMKILAVLALIFLPATFTTGLLDMGYISVPSISNGLLHVEVQPEFWLFLIITFSLMAVTITVWIIWELRQRSKRLVTREKGMV